MSFTLEQLLGAVAAAVLLPTAGFLLRWWWERRWRKADAKVTSDGQDAKQHAERLGAVERRIDLIESKHEDRQQQIGRLESEHSVLAGKVVGLQEFWRGEFVNLRKELREDHQKLREELRQDQANTEQRLTVLMTGHQQRVHDRLNVIAADQAKLLTEFVDQIVDRKAGGT